MYKKIIITLLSISCSARNITTPPAAVITAASLVVSENKFENTYSLGSNTVVFNRDNTYKIDYASEGRYWHEVGHWQISGSDLLLTVTGCDYDDQFEKGYKCSGSFGGGVCKVHEDDFSLRFALKLVCSSSRNNDIGWGRNFLSYSVQASRIAPNTRLTRKGIDMITLGGLDSILTETANLREFPNVQSKRIDYLPYDFYDNPNYPKSVPKGTKIKLLARTAEKSMVNNTLNYWYCIEVGALGNIWVFGEYVKQ